MKRTRYFLPTGLLLFFALCMVPTGEAQVRTLDSKLVTASGTSLTELNAAGAMNASFEYLITGSPATISIVVSGCKQGGTCDSLDTYTTVSNAVRGPSIGKAYDYFTVAVSWTGGTNPTVTVNTTLLTAGGGGGGGGGGNSTIVNPVDGSGYVNVDCKTGCSGNANGQATMANSAPVVIASNQSAVAVTAAQATAANLNATVVQATGSNLHTAVDSLPALPNGGNTIGALSANQSVNVNQVGGTGISLYATLFNAVVATGTATSSAIRIPSFSGYGTLQITGASITGSPSGCQVALAYQPNTGSPASSAQATISFTPATSTQLFAVAPTNPSGDQFVATYSCGTYPTGGTISVTFAPTGTFAIVNALPTGANTIGAVTQASGPWTDNVTQFGGSNVATGTGAGGAGIPRVTISNDSSLAANQSVNLNQEGGTAITNTPTAIGTKGAGNVMSVNADITSVVGTAAAAAAAGVLKVGVVGASGGIFDGVVTAAAAPARGIDTLAEYLSAAPAPTTGQTQSLQTDAYGNLLTMNYRRAQTKGQATTIASSSSATTVVTAQAAGVFADISTLIITVTPAASTAIQFTATLSDGTNSYVFDCDTSITAATGGNVGGCVNANFTPPLHATTAATAWTVQLSVATVTVHISVAFVLQQAS